ncbi:MAG TPA: hypothetical protein VGG14_19515 [Candidatus Sulfotelmatobacter sp.]
MSNVSSARKLGVVARVARQQAGRSRTLRATKQAALTTSRAFGRILHQLWLEVTGLIFLIMSVSFAAAAVKEYSRYHAGEIGPNRMALAICFTLAFAWFGISSFWKVRKKKNQRAR